MSDNENTAQEQQPQAARAKKGSRIWVYAAVVVVAAAASAGITALVGNIGQHKGEAVTTYTQVVDLGALSIAEASDPEVWGQNFPLQYDLYLATADFTPTDHSPELVPVTGPRFEGDPEVRTETTESKVETDPRLKTMWNGYAFAIDYRHLRGHEYMLTDQRYTLRVLQRDQPGACLNCHASTVEIMDELGDGDQMAGWAAMNKMPYNEATTYANHPVTCIDCHDPGTMELRITRPALINGLKALKASEGIADYDVNKDATTQEMRTYVCAQCHVEYYFAGDDKTLTFPWAKGTDIDSVWAYYSEIGFTDFTHKTTEAKVVKAQHPEFEAWSAGVHAANGVTCADCHMNYTRVGSQKVSNHDLTTPLVDVNSTCGTCHTASTEVITDRVETIQNRFIESRDRSLDALTQLIAAIEKAKTNGTNPDWIAAAQQYQNKASFYVDYAYSENSYGFHAPDYFQRLLSDSLDASRKGQLVLLGVPEADIALSDVAVANAEIAQESGNR